jgi:hypothetical protein
MAELLLDNTNPVRRILLVFVDVRSALNVAQQDRRKAGVVFSLIYTFDWSWGLGISHP